LITVEIVEMMKVKKIDLDKADVVKQEVCSTDEVMHKSPATTTDNNAVA